MPDNSHPVQPDIAIILAGGLGTRLRSVVLDRPKVLAPAAGQPFLGYLLTYLAGQGIRKVILSLGYLAEQVQNFAGDGSAWGITIEYVQEAEPLGTGGAIKLASRGLESAFFAMNGDTLFEVSLTELWRCHIEKQAAATISLRLVPVESGDHEQRGCVSLDENRFIIDFSEKPGAANLMSSEPAAAGSLLTNGGIYVLTPAALADIETGWMGSLEQEIFPGLAANRRLAGCPQQGYFIDIGTPENLAKFERDRAIMMRTTAPADSSAFIVSEYHATAGLLQQMAAESVEQVAAVAETLITSLNNGHQVLIFGNGGSAADAQHFAAELAGRYRLERRALPALALTTDTSMLTAISNDYGFTQVFARQVEALVRPGDVVIGISTSGRSANVIAGLQAAHALGARTVALLGASIVGLAGVADQIISVPSTDTPRIQEVHAVIIHILCDLVEKSITDFPNNKLSI